MDNLILCILPIDKLEMIFCAQHRNRHKREKEKEKYEKKEKNNLALGA